MDERDCVLVENSDIGKLEEIRADMNNFVGTMEAPADDLPPEDQEQHIANTVKQVHDFLTQKNASYPILLSASCLNAHSEYMKTKILPSLILAGAEKHFHGGDSGRSQYEIAIKYIEKFRMHFIYGFLKKPSDHFLFELWSSIEEKGREANTRVSTRIKVQVVESILAEAEEIFKEEKILQEIKCIDGRGESEKVAEWKKKNNKLISSVTDHVSSEEKLYIIAFVLKKLDSFKDTQTSKFRNVITVSVKAYFDKDSPSSSSSSLNNTTPILENHFNVEGIVEGIITISLSSSLLSSDIVTTIYYSFRYIRRSRSQRRGGRSRSHTR